MSADGPRGSGRWRLANRLAVPAEVGLPRDPRIEAFLNSLAAAVARLILAEIRDANRQPQHDATSTGSPSDTN